MNGSETRKCLPGAVGKECPLLISAHHQRRELGDFRCMRCLVALSSLAGARRPSASSKQRYATVWRRPKDVGRAAPGRVGIPKGSARRCCALRDRVIDATAEGALTLASSGEGSRSWLVRFSVFILAVIAAAVCTSKSAAAQTDAWCAYYDLGKDGFRSCRFATLQQCLEDVRGIGGNCGPSPYPSSPAPSTRRSKRHHHY